MRTLTFITSLVFLLTAAASGQLVKDLHKVYSKGYYDQTEFDSSAFKPWKRFTPGKTDYSFEVGTGYSSFGRGIGFSSSYISPSVIITPSQNFMIEVGGRFSYNNYSGAPMFMQQSESGAAPTSPGNPTEAYAYGRYIVNDRLSVYGLGAFGNNQLYFSPYSSGFSTSNYQHLSFGMDYRVSEKFSIGASFGVTNGPSWGNSFQRNGWSPFMP
jgi:hypothetical protein